MMTSAFLTSNASVTITVRPIINSTLTLFVPNSKWSVHKVCLTQPYRFHSRRYSTETTSATKTSSSSSSSLSSLSSTTTCCDKKDDDSNNTNKEYEEFMRHALRQARLAYTHHEVPIGAVLVDAHGDILACGHNLVESLKDATRHAELVTLHNLSTTESTMSWRVPPGCTLYCTLEPCAMCVAALQLARVDHIVYGANDVRLGACGTWTRLHEQPKHPFHLFKSVVGGVLAHESSTLLKQFFKERRNEPPRYTKE